MASMKHEQCRLTHRGRTFHFVSYEAEDANPDKKLPGRPPTWYLVSSNNRWPAIPYLPEQTAAEVEAQCVAWLEAVVFAAAPPAPAAAPEPPQRFLRPDPGVAPI